MTRDALSRSEEHKKFLLEVTKDKTRGIVAKTGPPCPFVQSDSILPSKEKEKKFSQEILSAVNKKCFFLILAKTRPPCPFVQSKSIPPSKE